MQDVTQISSTYRDFTPGAQAFHKNEELMNYN